MLVSAIMTKRVAVIRDVLIAAAWPGVLAS